MAVVDRETAIASAWQEYLDTTRGVRDVRYDEIEPWAWRQLRRKLASHAKKGKVVNSGT